MRSICKRRGVAQAMASPDGRRERGVEAGMRSLFNRWRAPKDEAGPLYSALVSEARRPAWYVDGGVADTLDGRFAVLSSLVALAILRLEDGEEAAARGSVALTESFIADMDAQMREVGFGDPSIVSATPPSTYQAGRRASATSAA